MDDLAKSILKNSFVFGTIGFVLFLLIPEIRIYIAIITVIVVIALIEKMVFTYTLYI